MSNMNNVVEVSKVLIDRVRDLCRKSFASDVQAFRDIEAVLPPVDEEYVLERFRHFAQRGGMDDKNGEAFAAKVWKTVLMFPVEVGHFNFVYLNDDNERKADVLTGLKALTLRDLDARLRRAAERRLETERNKTMNAALEQSEEQRIKIIKDTVQLRGAADASTMSVDDMARLALTKLTFASPPGGDGMRWDSKTVDSYLDTLSEQEARSVLKNAGEFVVQRCLRPETLRYAVIEISDLKSAAFRELGGQAQMVSILREVGQAMLDRLVEPTRFADNALELPVRDVNYNDVGRYLVMTGVQLEHLKKNKPNSLLVSVNIDQAALLFPNKTEVAASEHAALDDVQAVSQQFILLANDFEKMSADHYLLGKSFKTAGVEVSMPEGGLLVTRDLLNKDSVFNDVTFMLVDGYLKADKASFVDALCCIGDVGDLDDLSEIDEAINEQILHYFANEAEFEGATNGDGLDFVITKKASVLLKDVIVSLDVVTPSIS